MLYHNYKVNPGDTSPLDTKINPKVKVMRVATRHSLPLDASMGDICFTTDTKDCFVFNGVSWVLTSNVSNKATISAGILEKKRCPYCNTIISDEDIHCKSCGAPVEKIKKG